MRGSVINLNDALMLDSLLEDKRGDGVAYEAAAAIFPMRTTICAVSIAAAKASTAMFQKLKLQSIVAKRPGKTVIKSSGRGGDSK
jgi:hypothetical protein